MVRPPAHSVALLHHGLVSCAFLITRFLKYIPCCLFMNISAYYELVSHSSGISSAALLFSRIALCQ